MKQYLIVFMLLFITTGCSTAYHKFGDQIWPIEGGYSDKVGPGELIEVVFEGNQYSEKEQMDLYLLYRCAELTKEKGKQYFSMYYSIAHAILGRPFVGIEYPRYKWDNSSRIYILPENGPSKNTFHVSTVINKYFEKVKG